MVETDLEWAIAIFTNPQVTRYIGGPQTRERVTREWRNGIKRCARGCIGKWCVIEQSTNDKIGTALLLPLAVEEKDTDWDLLVGDDLPHGEIEIGYILKQSAWGKGYATEACKRLLRLAFEQTQLDEVVAVTHPENAASQHVLRKSGLIDEGLRRAFAMHRQGFRITRRQWSENQKLA